MTRRKSNALLASIARRIEPEKIGPATIRNKIVVPVTNRNKTIVAPWHSAYQNILAAPHQEGQLGGNDDER
jgi:hypothetical protein